MSFDKFIANYPGFPGYEGNPPSSEEEYNNLFSSWENKPSWSEVSPGIELAIVQKQRSFAYPNIADQLDMLYHDIKAGTLDTGAWIQAIEAVKIEYPKP